MIKIKRIYEEPHKDDGYRVLVDRLWPRGLRKQDAAIDVWLKEVAPSKELREWFDHKPERFKEFATRYKQELRANSAHQDLVDVTSHHKIVTLLYAAHDTKYNQAQVLLDYLQNLTAKQ
jgi:uncharacterized protein YeaO (DUF488 family)